MRSLQTVLANLFAQFGGWDLFASSLAVFGPVLLVVVLIIRFLIMRKLARFSPYRPVLRRIFRYGLGLALGLMVLVFFRWERVQYLSSPWILYVWLLLFAGIAIWIGVQFMDIPAQLEALAEQRRKETWKGRNTKKPRRR